MPEVELAARSDSGFQPEPATRQDREAMPVDESAEAPPKPEVPHWRTLFELNRRSFYRAKSLKKGAPCGPAACETCCAGYISFWIIILSLLVWATDNDCPGVRIRNESEPSLMHRPDTCRLSFPQDNVWKSAVEWPYNEVKESWERPNWELNRKDKWAGDKLPYQVVATIGFAPCSDDADDEVNSIRKRMPMLDCAADPWVKECAPCDPDKVCGLDQECLVCPRDEAVPTLIRTFCARDEKALKQQLQMQPNGNGNFTFEEINAIGIIFPALPLSLSSAVKYTVLTASESIASRSHDRIHDTDFYTHTCGADNDASPESAPSQAFYRSFVQAQHQLNRVVTAHLSEKFNFTASLNNGTLNDTFGPDKRVFLGPLPEGGCVRVFWARKWIAPFMQCFHSQIVLFISCIFLLEFLMTEKEARLREMLLIAGVSKLHHIVGHMSFFFTKALPWIFVASVVPWAFLTPSSNPLFMLFLCMAQIISFLSIMFCSAAFCNSIHTAGPVSGIFIVWSSIAGILATFGVIPVLPGLCLLPPVAFAYCGRVLLQTENLWAVRFAADVEGKWLTGLNFENMFDPSLGLENLSFGFFFGMVLFDALLYFSLAWYLNEVVSSAGGRSKSICFCFGGLCRTEPAAATVHDADGSSNGVQMRIKNLVKAYSRPRGDTRPGQFKAVDGFNLEAREGEITALLGHNGAGKSTTIAMLVGILEASDGDATIYTHSVKSDLEAVRRDIGIVFQHDVLWPHLTVAEHVRFFAALRGMSSGDVLDQHVTKIIEEVDLQDKEDALADNLSGGQKRKLCLAMALVSAPRVLILDEPTAAMDPKSRRHIWRLLENLKKGRVILLTTHFMDEADLLGDHVAIMTAGKMNVEGSSVFLKTHFGIGYRLALSGNLDIDELTNDVRKFVPAATLEASELVDTAFFRLPVADADAFPDLLDSLNSKRNELNGLRFTLNAASLEEVFIRLADIEDNANVIEADDPDEKVVDATNSFGSIAQTTCLSQLSASWLMRNREDRANWKRNCVLILPCCIPLTIFILRLWLFQVDLLLKPINETEVLINSSANGVAAEDRRFIFYSDCSSALPENCLWPFSVSETSQSMHDLMGITIGQVGELPFSSATRDTSRGLVGAAVLLPSTSPFLPRTVSFNISNRANCLEVGCKIVEEEGDVARFILFNGSVPFALPETVNLISTMTLQSLSGVPTSGFEVSYAASPTVSLARAESAAGLEPIAQTIGGLYLSESMVNFAKQVSLLCLMEAHSGFKAMMVMGGARLEVYWGALQLNFLLKYCFIIAFFLIMSASLPIASVNAAVEGFRGIYIALIMLLGMSSLMPAAFLFSLLSGLAPELASNMFGLGVQLSTVVLILTLWTVQAIWPLAAVGLQSLAMLIVPTYCVFKGLTGIDHACLNEYNCEANSMPTVIQAILSLAVCQCIWFGVLIKLERRRIWQRQAGATTSADQNQLVHQGVEQDEDVLQEKQRVVSGEAERAGDGVIIAGLSKSYPRKRAVSNLYLSVPKGQCLGLLGPNGAGKTTVANMLSGSETPTGGTALVFGSSIATGLETIHKNMGFCPQSDAMSPFLTVTEVFDFFGNLRGITNLQQVTELLITMLRLDTHRFKEFKMLSGGNKRKVSLGVALLGGPSVMFLDEPSTGMDPQARRSMWTAIKSILPGRSAVLTTHLMDEAEALCNRIAILVNGQLAAVGSVPHLKTKFGGGMLLELVCSSLDKVDAIKAFILELCPEAVLLDFHRTSLRYNLPSSSDVTLAKAFRLLQASKLKEGSGLDHYVLSETTLEQVFLDIAKEQVSDKIIMLRHLKSNEVVDAADGRDKQAVVLRPAGARSSAQWSVEYLEGAKDVVLLRSVMSGLYLHVASGGIGEDVVQASSTNKNSLWKLCSPPNAESVLLKNKKSGLYLSVVASLTSPAYHDLTPTVGGTVAVEEGQASSGSICQSSVADSSCHFVMEHTVPVEK